MHTYVCVCACTYVHACVNVIALCACIRAVPIPGICIGIGPIPAFFDGIGIGQACCTSTNSVVCVLLTMN